MLLPALTWWGLDKQRHRQKEMQVQSQQHSGHCSLALAWKPCCWIAFSELQPAGLPAF